MRCEGTVSGSANAAMSASNWASREGRAQV